MLDPVTPGQSTPDLTRLAVHGSAYSLGAQGTRILLHLAGIGVLARLLTAEDFGIFGMAAFVAGLAGVLIDLGLNQATIQRASLSERELSTLFWLMMGTSAVACLVTVVGGQAAAAVYGDPRVGPVATVLSLSSLAAGIGAQHYALLSRELRFDRLALAQIVSPVVGFAAAILVAAAGAGYWALVVQQLTTVTTLSVMFWTMSGWVPCARPAFESVRDLLPLGMHLAGFRVVNHLARNLDNALIGWMSGPQVLGHYTRAYSLFLQPLSNINGPIGRVMVATLSRARDDAAEFARLYVATLRVTCWMILPLVAFLAAAADDVVYLFLGPGWEETALLFRLLSISAVGQAIAQTMGWIYVALGRGRAMLKWGAFSSALVVGSFLVGLPFGASGVALAYSAMMSVLAPVGIYYGTRGTRIRFRAVMLAAAPPSLSAAFVGLSTLALSRFVLADWPVIGRLSVLAAAAMSSWLLAVMLSGEWREARRLLSRQPDLPAPVVIAPILASD